MSGRRFHVIKTNPWAVLRVLWFKMLVLWISQKPNIEIKGNLVLKGKPIIDIHKGSYLYLGDGVRLNSRNRDYHINMHSPVKLFADRPGAEIRIGDRTRIHGTCIHAHQSVEIGQNCLIAANCQIFDSNGHNISFPDVHNRLHTNGTSKPIKIADNVWIGANTVILPGVTIGEGSVISANSVVHRDIPSMVVAGGNPAKLIRTGCDAVDRIDQGETGNTGDSRVFSTSHT